MSRTYCSFSTSCFLCTAWRPKGGYWEGSRNGAKFRPLLWCNHREHGSRAGFPRAAQADRQAGHGAPVGAHLLAVLEVTGLDCSGPQGWRSETERNVPVDGQCWPSLDFHLHILVAYRRGDLYHVLQGRTLSHLSLCVCVSLWFSSVCLLFISVLCKVIDQTHRNVPILFAIVIYNCKYIHIYIF